MLSSSVISYRSAITSPGFISTDSNYTELWNVTGSGIYYNGGNVGIGTLNPVYKLDVIGIISATGGNSTVWNLAYSWGNHALAGYIISESDPLFFNSPAYNITNINISNWNTAYSWGNHADEGYIDSESDPTVPLYVKQITTNNISNWSEAYSWGNHALAGYYPYSNPYNFLNATDLYNETTGIWVKVTGDTMTGNLNMSDQNITDIDTLFVHNISGRSPIYVSSEIISYDSITAGTFYGNINGTNGTLFGVTINNGTIKNLNVGDSAYFDTNVTFNGSLIPAINNTYTLGIPDYMWKQLYVDELITNNLSSPDIDILYNLTAEIKQPYGKLLISNTTNFWINETLLNNTIENISKVRTIQYNLTCTTSSGTCNIISPINIYHEITEVIVTPTTPNTNYRFLLTEYPVIKVIDQDRKVHVGIWDIEKNYGINNQVQATITSASSDELFTITIIYLTNGVE